MIDVSAVPWRKQVFCGGQIKGGAPGQTCRKPAGAGTSHAGLGRCSRHMGATPTHVAGAQLDAARSWAALYGVPRKGVDPISGLIEELERSAGLIDSYEAMCAQLMPDEVVYGVLSEESTRTTDPNAGAGGEAGADLAPVETKTRRGAALNMWVRLLDAERDRFARLCEAMVKLDLESRRVAIGQEQVAAMVQLLLSADLALTDDQKRAAARMLRTLDRQQAIDAEVVG